MATEGWSTLDFYKLAQSRPCLAEPPPGRKSTAFTELHTTTGRSKLASREAEGERKGQRRDKKDKDRRPEDKRQEREAEKALERRTSRTQKI